MAEERLTPDQRAQVKELIRVLYKLSSAKRWADFARLAGVSEYSLAEWRSDKDPTLPNSYNLLLMLRAVGIVDDELRLREREAVIAQLQAEVAELRAAAAQRLKEHGNG